MKKHSLLLFVFVVCACSKPAGPDMDETASSQEAAKEAVAGDEETGTDASLPNGEKSAGVYTVLGLEIPERMAPAKGPAKIFRFEGILPVPQATEAMKRQVRPKWTEKEGTGSTFKEARVRFPKGKSEGKELVNIRIFKGRKGGSVIDIWVATPETAAGQGEDKPSATGYTGPTSAQREKRNRANEETLRVMNKIGRGQRTDEKDKDSPFFY